MKTSLTCRKRSENTIYVLRVACLAGTGFSAWTVFNSGFWRRATVELPQKDGSQFEKLSDRTKKVSVL